MDVEAEVEHLVKEIERLGTKGPDGKAVVKYHLIKETNQPKPLLMKKNIWRSVQWWHSGQHIWVPDGHTQGCQEEEEAFLWGRAFVAGKLNL